LWGARRSSARLSTFTLRSAHLEMLQRDLAVTWLDPDEASFGLSAVARGLNHRVRASGSQVLTVPHPRDKAVVPCWDSVDASSVAGGELWHPQLVELREATDVLRLVRLQQLHSCLSLLLKRRNAGKRDAVAKMAAISARRHRAETFEDPPSVLVRPFTPPTTGTGTASNLEVSAIERGLLESSGLAAIVDASDPSDAHVYGPPRHWHSLVVLRLLRRERAPASGSTRSHDSSRTTLDARPDVSAKLSAVNSDASSALAGSEETQRTCGCAIVVDRRRPTSDYRPSR